MELIIFSLLRSAYYETFNNNSFAATIAEAKTSGGLQVRRSLVSLQVYPLIQLLRYRIFRTRAVYTRTISRPYSPRQGILTCLFPGSCNTIFPLPHVRYAACLTSMVKDPALKTINGQRAIFPVVLPQGVFKLYTLLTASASCADIIFFLYSRLTGRTVKTDAQQRDFAEVKIPNNLIEHFPVMA